MCVCVYCIQTFEKQERVRKHLNSAYSIQQRQQYVRHIRCCFFSSASFHYLSIFLALSFGSIHSLYYFIISFVSVSFFVFWSCRHMWVRCRNECTKGTDCIAVADNKQRKKISFFFVQHEKLKQIKSKLREVYSMFSNDMNDIYAYTSYRIVTFIYIYIYIFQARQLNMCANSELRKIWVVYTST